MKELIIHVGFPKTATTSIQKLIFHKLHERGDINCPFNRGSALTSKLESISNHQVDPKFALSLDANKLDGSKISLTIDSRLLGDQLKDSVVNIISDESLTLPYLPVKINPNYVVARFSRLTPEILHSLFDSYAIRTTILVVLRNQRDLLESMYAEWASMMPVPKAFESAAAFYFEKSLNLNESPSLRRNELLEQFNFYKTLSAYASYFGSENVHVLLYEDLVHRRSFFIEEFARIIQYNNPDFLEPLLSSQNAQNVKARSSDGGYSITPRTPELILGRQLSRSLKPYYNIVHRLINQSFPNFSLKSWFESLPVIKAKISSSNAAKSLSPLSDVERHAIFDHFKSSNTDLANEFCLNMELLGRYGYL